MTKMTVGSHLSEPHPDRTMDWADWVESRELPRDEPKPYSEATLVFNVPKADDECSLHSPDLGPTADALRQSKDDRSVHHCFTWFPKEPHTEGILTASVESIAADPIVSYVLCGMETCPTTSRVHIQGYLQTTKAIRLAQVRKLLPAGAHVERALGTTAENVNYCRKEGQWKELGQARCLTRASAATAKLTTDYASVISLAKKGLIDSIAQDYPRDFLLRYQTIKAIAKDYQPTPSESPNVRGVWIVGAAGVGKSRLARQIYKPFYAKMANKWFDGYQDEPYIILDDVGHDQAKSLTYHLKIWTDRYPFVAEIKNGSKMIAPLGFILTSQYEIEDLWSDSESRDALKRRCTRIGLGDALLQATSTANLGKVQWFSWSGSSSYGGQDPPEG